MDDIEITSLAVHAATKMIAEGYRVQAVIPPNPTGPGLIIWERCPPPTLTASNLSGIPDSANHQDRRPVHIPPLTAAERAQPAQATQAPPTQQKAPSGPEIAKFDAWMGTSNLRGPSTGEYVTARNAFLNAYEMPNINPHDLLAKFRAAFPEVAQMMQDSLGKHVTHEQDRLVTKAIEYCLAHDKLTGAERSKLLDLRDALDSDSYLILTTLAPGEAP